MTETIVFISPTIDATMRQKLTQECHLRHIKTTDDIHRATLVIADCSKPVERMDIAILAEKLINEAIHKISIINHELFLLNNQKPKKQKTEFNYAQSLKQFNQTKRIQRQRFFNRTNCK